MDDLIKVIIKVIKKEDKLDTFSKGGDQRRKKAKKVVLFYSDQQTVFSTLATFDSLFRVIILLPLLCSNIVPFWWTPFASH